MKQEKIIHEPVLLKEVIKYLEVRSEGIYLDATLGDGGYSFEIIQNLDPNRGQLISLDWDQESIDFVNEHYKESIQKYNWKIFKQNFAELEKALKKAQVAKLDGIVFDLGLSSRQLDDPSRGFSYRYDTEMDMRMNNDMNISANDLVKVASKQQLAKIIKEYGEERFNKRIARVIKDYVNKNPNKDLKGSKLVELIRKVVPANYRKGSGHPARRTFQALRIAVNDELHNLAVGVTSALSQLAEGGRLVVVSYHSLEDRIVKNKFKIASSGDEYHEVVDGIVTPAKEEIERNPRASSAKLRVIKKNK